MTLCSGITVGAANANCDETGNGLITGAAETIMIYNFKDLPQGDDNRPAAFTFDVTDVNKVTAITNPLGIQAFSFEGYRRSHKPSYELVPGPNSVGYNHILDFVVHESSYAQKENLMRMNNGLSIVVIENLDKSSDNSFEIYGASIGLQAITSVRSVDDPEIGAGFTIQLSTGEDVTKEPLMPLTLNAGDYASTKAIFDGLVTPGV